MKYLYLLLIGIITLLPMNAIEAYVTTDQAAVQVSGTTALYFIEFEFGHGNHDIHMSVVARDSGERSRGFLSYNFFNNDDGRVTGINSAGIVLSNTPIEDGQYVIPKGEKHTLTLLVVASVPMQIKTEPIRAEVTYLPFSFDGEEELQLNPSELQYYRTPSLMLPIQVRVSNIEHSAS